MESSNDLSKAVDNLIKIIYSGQTSNEDKVDSYLTLFSHGQKNKDVTEERMKKESGKLLIVVKKHMLGNRKALVEAALSFLGQCLSSENIISSCAPEILTEMLNGLIAILRNNHDKSIYIRCFWCLSHQKIQPAVIKNTVEQAVSIFNKFCTDEKMTSETVLNEGLRMLKRFSEQCPETMEMNQELWIKHVFEAAISVYPKNRGAALDVIEVSMEFLLHRNHTFIQKFLLEQLNEKNLCTTLENFFHKKECPVHVLNLWACMLRLLGEGFFQMDRMKVTNPLLKIAEKAFGAKESEIKLALNNLWRALIDVVFMRPDEFQKKMEKVLLPPIKVSHRNEVVANEMLKTHWHLVCKLGENLNEYVEKVVIPLLDVYLSPLSSAPKNMAAEKIGLTTPDQSKKKVIPRTPKSPYIASNTTKILAMEMLTQLLTEQKDRINGKGFKLECSYGPMLSVAKLLEHKEKILTYIIMASESCTDKNDAKLSSLWTAFLISLRKITDADAKRSVWQRVLLTIEDMIDRSILSLTLTLKIFVLTPEEILHWSFFELQTSAVGSGCVWFFILRMLFHRRMLQNDAYEQERFFILYERMLGTIFESVSGQLQSTNMVFSLLEEKHKEICIQDVRWRLWSTLSSLLNSYISKTNDVNEGNSLDYSFATMLKALLYPLKSIDVTKLQDGTVKELLAVWTEAYQNFSRAVSLLSGIELNIASEEFMKQLLFCFKNELLMVSADSAKGYSFLLKMVYVVVRSMDFTDLPQSTKVSLTPSKVAKKLANPLGNFRSFIQTAHVLFVRFTNVLIKDGKTSEQPLSELINMLDHFYASIANNLVLLESLRVLVTPITKLLANRTACTPKLFMNVEKFVATIYSALETNKKLLYTQEFLNTFEPVLVEALNSTRKSLITRTVKFWNASFGKKPNLDYSNEIKDALLNCKSKVAALLPGHTTHVKLNVMLESQDETAQFPDVIKSCTSPKLKTKTAVSASPIKIRGSFLNGVKGEVKPQLTLFRSPAKQLSNSPGNKIVASNANKPVRRKLPLKNLKEETCTFVEIKNSPKKKRLLTDHQKEILRERKVLPVMYNNLDQSQDTTLFSSLSQDQTTQDITPADTNSSNQDVSQSILADDVVCKGDVTNDDVEKLKVMPKESDSGEHDDIFIVGETEDLDIANSGKHAEVLNDVNVSPDFVPSSQTVQQSTSICKEALSLIGELRKATVEKLTDTHVMSDGVSENENSVVKPSELFIGVQKDHHVPKDKADETIVESKKVLTEIKLEPSDQSSVVATQRECQKEAKIVLEKLPHEKVHNNKRKRVLASGNQNKRRKSDGDFLKQSSRHLKESLFDFNENTKSTSPVAGRTRKKDQKKKERSQSMGELTLDIKKESFSHIETPVIKNEDHISSEKDLVHDNYVNSKIGDESSDQHTCLSLKSTEKLNVVNSNSDQQRSDNPPSLHDVIKQKHFLHDTSSSSDNTLTESVTSSIPTSAPGPTVTFVHSASSFISLAHSPITEKLKQPSSLPPSPANGILKKRLNGGLDSPSPTNKSRRVSFQLPDGMLVCKEDIDDLAYPIQQTEELTKKFTVVKKKIKESRLVDSKIPVYPDLITCSAPIEKILPSLTFSRGISHVVRAQNIRTIGDLSSLSEQQIENLPIRSPKLKTVRNALSTFSAQMSRERPLPKSPLVIGQPTDKLLMDTTTPPKDDTLAKEAALLATPSRHNESVKPTSLFPDNIDSNDDDKVLEESFTISDKSEEEVVSLRSVEEELDNVDPVPPECNKQKDDKIVTGDDTLTCISETHTDNSVSEPDLKSVLSQINLSSLSTSIIFDLVGELDELKGKAMEELRTRMMAKSQTQKP